MSFLTAIRAALAPAAEPAWVQLARAAPDPRWIEIRESVAQDIEAYAATVPNIGNIRSIITHHATIARSTPTLEAFTAQSEAWKQQHPGSGLHSALIPKELKPLVPAIATGIIGGGIGTAVVGLTGATGATATAVSKLTSAAVSLGLRAADASPPPPPPQQQQPQGAVVMANGNFFPDFSIGDVFSQGLGILNTVLQQKLAAQARPAMIAAPAPAPVVAAVSLPGAIGAIGGAIGRIVGGTGAVVSAAAGVVRSVGGKILSVILPSGLKVSRGAAVRLAKTMGLQAAATALGITAVEMAEMVLQESSTKRRGRGITSAQMRTTRRTMRAVMGLHRQIVSACSSARVPSRARKACPPPRVIVARK